jgi:hypothetical protein
MGAAGVTDMRVFATLRAMAHPGLFNHRPDLSARTVRRVLLLQPGSSQSVVLRAAKEVVPWVFTVILGEHTTLGRGRARNDHTVDCVVADDGNLSGLLARLQAGEQPRPE